MAPVLRPAASPLCCHPCPQVSTQLHTDTGNREDKGITTEARHRDQLTQGPLSPKPWNSELPFPIHLDTILGVGRVRCVQAEHLLRPWELLDETTV